MTSALAHQLARVLRNHTTIQAREAYEAYLKATVGEVWRDADGNTYKDVEVVQPSRNNPAGHYFTVASLGADKLPDERVRVWRRKARSLNSQGKESRNPNMSDKSTLPNEETVQLTIQKLLEQAQEMQDALCEIVKLNPVDYVPDILRERLRASIAKFQMMQNAFHQAVDNVRLTVRHPDDTPTPEDADQHGFVLVVRVDYARASRQRTTLWPYDRELPQDTICWLPGMLLEILDDAYAQDMQRDREQFEKHMGMLPNDSNGVERTRTPFARNHSDDYEDTAVQAAWDGYCMLRVLQRRGRDTFVLSIPSLQPVSEDGGPPEA